MQTEDLRLLPSIMIWWNDGRANYPGWITRVYKGGIGDLIITSNAWGDRLEKTEIPYGKDKSFHWYFHTVTEETILFMKQLGYIMTEKEKCSADLNAHDTLKKIVHQQAEEARKAEEAKKADEAIVAEALDENPLLKKEGKNGHYDETAPTKKQPAKVS